MDQLKPGDVVKINNNGIEREMRLTRIEMRSGSCHYEFEDDAQWKLRHMTWQPAIPDPNATVKRHLVTEEQVRKALGMYPENDDDGNVVSTTLLDEVTEAANAAGLSVEAMLDEIIKYESEQATLPGLELMTDEEVGERLQEWGDILGDNDR